ncbi:MAG: type III-B CRISPR module RAMP protein Cmr1 [Chloroflexi bacterium]|nr:MAG: type III-B CRISPR module RAMP protein Cmr1 [Chloroflexota bacterium]
MFQCLLEVFLWEKSKCRSILDKVEGGENMHELTVTLETVTPMLIRGADNSTPELRPPSFRGAMRYWLRAALGGVIGDSNLDGLHKLESAVFGSTERGSAIGIRLRDLDTRKHEASILPHKNRGRARALSGGFELAMSQTRGADPAIWDAARASLELALTFGGVGLRSRRGYGTLRIVKAPRSGLPAFPATLNGWKAHVGRVAQVAIRDTIKLADAYNVPLSGLSTEPAAYPCATLSGLIRLCDAREHSAMQAVISFMKRTQENRAFGGIRPTRQASPLWMRPIQTGPTTYGLLCVVLASRFSGANYGFVKEFLGKFPGEYLRVKGWNA